MAQMEDEVDVDEFEKSGQNKARRQLMLTETNQGTTAGLRAKAG